MPAFSWQQAFVIAVAVAGVVAVLMTKSAEAGAIAIIVQAFLPSMLKRKDEP
jgi:hypothetical protein